MRAKHEPKVKSLKELAREYYQAVNNYDGAFIESLLEEDYIQHNPKVPTGRAAFISLLPALEKMSTKIRNIRMLQDGKHILMHHQWSNSSPFGADKMAAFHIIRFNQDEKIAEHWSVMVDDTKMAREGKSATDGSTCIEDLDKTNQNKVQIKGLFGILSSQGAKDWKKIKQEFFSLKQNAQGFFDSCEIVYQRQRKIFGEGNFTLSISEGLYKNVPSAIYDLFRLKNNLIVESWRIAQEIPSKNLANNNTFFGFENEIG